MNTLLIFIPGNPSIPGIYDAFIGQLQAQLGLSRSYVLSHRGQDADAHPVEQVDNLELLIQHHRQHIAAILNQEPAQKVYLLGHSLGSGIALSLYPEFAERIDKLVLLCPFLGPQANNRLFLRLLSVTGLNTLLQRVARRCLHYDGPSRYLLQQRMGLGAQAEPVRRSLTTRHFLANFLGLVSGYIHFFDKHNLKQRLPELPLPDTLFVFAHNDFWVPDQIIDTLPAGANYRQLDEVAHAFCLQPEQAAQVASTCSAFLQQSAP